MTLHEYVALCRANEDTPTQRVLFLNGEIVGIFRNLRGVSELEVLEHGVQLHWNTATDQITSPGARLKGTERGVDLQTRKAALVAGYIGDCHTHPYRRKMGTEAHIGPSSGDYEEWWRFMPDPFHIVLHFVISSSTVFLIVMREKTNRTVPGLYSSFGKVTVDTQTLGVVQDRCMTNEKFNKEYMAAYEATLPNGSKDWTTHREFEQKNFPGLAADFTQANLKMNTDLANQLHFEYFSGEMDENSKALSEFKLTLQSNPVYMSASSSAEFEEKKH